MQWWIGYMTWRLQLSPMKLTSVRKAPDEYTLALTHSDLEMLLTSYART